MAKQLDSDPTNLWSKLETAVVTLAGDGPLRGKDGRLVSAYISSFFQFLPESLPKRIRRHYEEITAAYVRSGPRDGLGSVEASMEDIGEAEAEALAEKIVRLYTMVVLLSADNLRQLPSIWQLEDD